ncbi:TlpA family protein disulfide reductase [Microbulbifer sp. VAAC004]|uniref:TlpA family protein disulfide reductase n=1 Tax=unclassified Microbulbifer TaxID=2619833 RepID=UPI00403A5869
MKKTLVVTSLFLVSVISACESDSRLHSVSGAPVVTEGKIVLVNYWAEWCKPCREEVPVLNELAQTNSDVVVVGVNFDGLPTTAAIEQAQKLGIEFPLLAQEPDGRWGQPWPEVLPTTLVIGEDGRWIKTLVGPQTAEDLKVALQ